MISILGRRPIISLMSLLSYAIIWVMLLPPSDMMKTMKVKIGLWVVLYNLHIMWSYPQKKTVIIANSVIWMIMYSSSAHCVDLLKVFSPRLVVFGCLNLNFELVLLPYYCLKISKEPVESSNDNRTLRCNIQRHMVLI